MAMHNFPFTIEDVCDLEKITYERNQRSSFKIICPVCGKHAMIINKNNDVYNCMSCNESGGVLQFYVMLTNQNITLPEARKEILERIYGGITDSTVREERIKEKKRVISNSHIDEEKLRSIDERDQTYKSLINLLILADDHKENLMNRGLPIEIIEANQYRTYPTTSMSEYPIKLLEEGVYLDGIPGFYKENNVWFMRTLKRGIMIPIRSHNNMIQGFQIRKDDKLLKQFYKRDAKNNYVLDGNKMRILVKEKKFTWLSSSDMNYGTGVKGFIHYACDYVLNNEEWEPKNSANKGILLTEGPLKADLFHYYTGYPAIAVPGVSCQYQLSLELDYLKKKGFNKIYNGYDMDYETNEHVEKALNASYDIIRSKGFELIRLTWDKNYKGIDDFYNAKMKGLI